MPNSIEYIMANSIWEDLSSPTSLSVPTISGRLVSQVNLGSLNNKLAQNFSIVSGAYFDSYLSGDAPALYIYTQLYKYNYYINRANKIGASSTINWTTLAEGDTKITRSDNINLVRVYRDLANEAAK